VELKEPKVEFPTIDSSQSGTVRTAGGTGRTKSGVPQLLIDITTGTVTIKSTVPQC
jgi:hypothetical protein